MNSQFVRIILPSNKNIQLLAPLQPSLLQHPRPCISGQIRLVNSNAQVIIPSGTSPTLGENTASRLPLSSLNINNQILQEKCSSIAVKSLGQGSAQLMNIAETAAPENNFVQCNSISNTDGNSVEIMPPSSAKRNHSSSCQSATTLIKKSFTSNENEQSCSKKFKRGKNWSEEETAIFISIWSDHYASLMTGGSRNSPIYQSMAQQLNQLLSPRLMTGGDVRSKITNLVCEYRKKKKELGRTGSSPSSWRYFDQIDKLLGERPFNDESLMSDSISLQQEQFLEEIENASVSDLNINSLTEDFDDNVSNLIKEIEESTNNSDNRSCISKSPSNSTSIQKNTTVNTPDTSSKKIFLSKKKKVVDMRIDLIQQMISKIDGANETANRAEIKALALLEKQTKLQEESLNNEREFLNVFRSIASSFNTSR